MGNMTANNSIFDTAGGIEVSIAAPPPIFDTSGGILSIGSNYIGGIPIGHIGTTGIYNNYTMVGGDDFNESAPNIVGINAPLAKYFPTHTYGAGARSFNGLLQYSFDADPLCTGSQDSNRGVAVGFSNMSQSSSILTLKARVPNAGETAYCNGKPILGAMIDSGGYLVATPPCIIEAYVSCDAFAASGVPGHFTFWIENGNPLNNPQTGTPGWLEFDFPECFGNQPQANVNVHGTTGGSWATDSTTLSGAAGSFMGSGFALFSLVITASSVLYYFTQNGTTTLVKTESHDGTITGNPYRILFTSHTYDSTYGDSTAAWTTQGATGWSLKVDYYRVWTATSGGSPLITPAFQGSGNKVAYNTSMNITLPSASTLYGGSVTTYATMIKKEDFAPGSSAEACGSFTQFAAGLSYNSGTGVLSGITTDKKPGRINIAIVPYLAGSLGQVYRDWIDIAPTILTAPTLTIVNGEAFTYDLYFDCDCGDLVPKVITCTGLPAWASFDGISKITGTPNANATTGITVGVTNASGQTATASVNITVVASATVLSVDTASAVTNASSTATITTTGTNELIIASILASPSTSGQGLNGSVLRVSSTSGLIWRRYKNPLNVSFSSPTNLEIWYAWAPSILVSEVITAVPASGTIGRVTAFGIIGANAVPFDQNASAYETAQGTTATSLTATVSTNASHAVLIAVVRSLATLGTITQPSGFTRIPVTGSGTASDSAYDVISSPASALAVQYQWTGTTTNAAMQVFAIQGM